MRRMSSRKRDTVEKKRLGTVDLFFFLDQDKISKKHFVKWQIHSTDFACTNTAFWLFRNIFLRETQLTENRLPTIIIRKH